MTHGSGGASILPAWVDVLWIVALAAVLVFHCICLARMGVEHRWLHLAHAAMIVGMIYMYAASASAPTLVSARVWMWFYVVTTSAIVVWMLVCSGWERPFSYLWWPALVQQAAMIYMWASTSDWVAWLTYTFAFYFLIEALAWLLGLRVEGMPGNARAFGPGARSMVVPLGDGSPIGKISMATMAASMGYMFVGMQLRM